MRLTRHYVYRTTYLPTGEFYIGVRSCVSDPMDDKYLGSGRFTFISKYGRKGFQKETVAEFHSREEAELFEVGMISANKSDPLCENIRTQRYNYSASTRTRGVNKCM